MDGPVYKLEQVVHSREGMTDFEGPLDLILFLLSKNKIEIQDIPIALILEQYLAYLDLRQQMDLEVASEFVAMAAQLMFIKTRMLLSLEDAEAQSEMEQLVKALEERRSSENYEKIKYITGRFGQMGEFGRNIMVKNPEPMERGGKVYQYSHRPSELLAAWREINDRGDRRTPPPLSNFSEIVRQEPYPVEAKARDIMRLLRQGVGSFRLLFRGSGSRSEIVATFLAVLELCKARIICLTGSESECTVTATGESLDKLQL
ncbi:MAG: segregation/condensation protein A [Oscillospiraceae bacterium]|nr:segregation/condensation protein A [Oscillospiraceae bacterium]